jgi:hypothetical protein
MLGVFLSSSLAISNLKYWGVYGTYLGALVILYSVASFSFLIFRTKPYSTRTELRRKIVIYILISNISGWVLYSIFTHLFL